MTEYVEIRNRSGGSIQVRQWGIRGHLTILDNDNSKWHIPKDSWRSLHISTSTSDRLLECYSMHGDTYTIVTAIHSRE